MASDSDSDGEISQLYGNVAMDSEVEPKAEPKAEPLPAKVKSVGSRQLVWEGLAKKTAGGLTKADLFMCEKSSSIKSVKASNQSRTAMASRSVNKTSPIVKAEVSKIEKAITKMNIDGPSAPKRVKAKPVDTKPKVLTNDKESKQPRKRKPKMVEA